MNAMFSNFCKADMRADSATVRRAAVAGSFYPARKDDVEQMLKDFFGQYADVQARNDVAAVIVPHAGYVFSGAVAAAAFAQISSDRLYERVFLLGPSHHVYMDGASVNNAFEYYDTPLGKVKVDLDVCNNLLKANAVFRFDARAHLTEHCLEVQLPFLQYHLRSVPPIVPVIIGTQSLSAIEEIAKALKPYFNRRNLFVISSDFSHYPSYADAVKLDGATGEALETGRLDSFVDAIDRNAKAGISNLATSACGQCAIASLLYMMQDDKDVSIRHLLYRNSGDSSYGDHQRVVGYHAFAVYRQDENHSANTEKETSFMLSGEDKGTLLKLARKSISSAFKGGKEDSLCDENRLSAVLRMKCGAFVTLREAGHLRGCIGLFGSTMPLYRTVIEMARAAAFEDPRFARLSYFELDKIQIEISVLSPMKKINSIDEFELGKQGIYLSKNGRSGTFLPQVADETHWNKEEFLEHCAHDKAGLPWNAWKDADLYTYEAVVFEEDEQ